MCSIVCGRKALCGVCTLFLIHSSSIVQDLTKTSLNVLLYKLSLMLDWRVDQGIFGAGCLDDVKVLLTTVENALDGSNVGLQF